MKRTGHDKNAPSESLSDTEQNFLKRYSLKKITVPKEKLRDIVNLTVQKDEDDLEKWLNPNYKISKKAAAEKCERLEYRDLSKVLRSNVPWWLGTRGAPNNLNGQRLVSLVEVTDEESNFRNQRLEAGVEKNFRKMDSKCSVDVAEILSKGMEVCLMNTGKSSRRSTNAMPQIVSKQRETKVTNKHINDFKSEHNNKKMEISQNLDKRKNITEEIKAGTQTENEYKMSYSTNSTEMAWIEERLDRVQQLLMSLEDLRLQSGCEKCQGRGMAYGQQDDYCDNPVEESYNGPNGAHNSMTSNGQERRLAFRDSDAIGYAKELLKSNDEENESILETKICRCDLEIIDKEMMDLYCFLEELAEKQASPQDKIQYEIIMCRMQEIRECFCRFTNKILENSQSMAARETQLEVQEADDYIQKAEPVQKRGSLGDVGSNSNAACCCSGSKRKGDCIAAGPLFLDPPEAWCAQIKQDADISSCTKMVFVPCFYYNPTTGECKFTESKNQETAQPNCNCQQDPNSTEPCCCWTCEPCKSDVVTKKKFPLNLNELLSQISIIQGKQPPTDNKAVKRKENKADKGKQEQHKDKDKSKDTKTKKEKEKDKDKGKSSDKKAQSGNNKAAKPTKLPVSQQNSARLQEILKTCSPRVNRSVGKILLQDMTIEPPTADTFENNDSSCCCTQEASSQEASSQENLTQETDEDEMLTSCPCRSRGSGLDEASMIAISSNQTKDLSQDFQTMCNKTSVKIETVDEMRKRSKQETPRSSSQESTGKTNHEPRKSPKQEPLRKSNQTQPNKVIHDEQTRLKKEPSKVLSPLNQKNQDKQQKKHLTLKVSIHDNSQSTKQALCSDSAIKPMRPSVTFKSQPSKELCEEKAQNSIKQTGEDLGQKLKDVCNILCDNSFKKLSDSCKNLYENPSDPTKQMCDIPCKTLCDLCKKSCNGAIEKLSSNIANPIDQSETVDPCKENENFEETPTTKQVEMPEKPSEQCEELLKNYEIFKNYVKPILGDNQTKRVGNMEMSVHQSLSRLGSFMPDRQFSNSAPFPPRTCTCNMNSPSKLQDTSASIINENSDSVVTVKSACCGDAPQSPLCQCCCCEGVPPIEHDLGNIIQNRTKNRKRGTVYLKFTMSPNNLFHIQMATINNEFLGCFYATETAVMDARRNNGFDGCITLSVMEPSNSPSQINRLVDHAFMVVQQDRKS